MKTFPILCVIIGAAILASGCSTLTPLTQTLREEYKLTEAEMQKLHYYLSKPIVMEQQSDKNDVDITEDHGLRLSKGRVIDQVVIPVNTSGIAEAVGPQSLSISFEKNTALTFRPGEDETSKWSKYYRLSPPAMEDGKRRIQYGEDEYILTKSSTSTILMVKKKELTIIERNRRIARGRTLD